MPSIRWSISPALALVLAGSTAAPAAAQTPSFEALLSLADAGVPAISPDGGSVAYTVTRADWDANRYDSEIWLWREGGGAPFQLTRTADGGSTSPGWSPDGRWLAFLADRGEGTQVHVLHAGGGEALAVTAVEGGVDDFAWAPDGGRLAFTRTEPASDSMKALEEEYGAWEVDDEGYRMTHLWLVDVDPAGEPAAPRRLTGVDDQWAFTVGSFDWSPDGSRIVFDHRPDPLINSWLHTDLSIIEVASGEITPLVAAPSSQSNPIWSPDGSWIAYSAGPADVSSAFYLNSGIARVPARGGEPELLTASFDEDAYPIAWIGDGILFVAGRGVERRLHVIEDDGDIDVAATGPPVVGAVAVSPNREWVAFTASSPETLDEVYRSSADRYDPERLTDLTSQIGGWSPGTSEVVSWESRDGTRIEGVLRKPADFDPARRYPLLVVIHGGPTGTSRPSLAPAYVYPITQWLNRGAVVLEPNYRGSAGYGEAFRSLNVRNLGVGDAWDVLSGVDHLVDAGIAHPDSLGAMGWSQGGYISAFLTTTTDRFRAISVGAGISDWMTYYVNTDIHPFTRQYLKATPWEDPEIYAKTSPMTFITDASTPTLIQHGEFDRRVPIPNAYQLLQGLRDQGVPARLVVYKGFGHGITNPRERLAAMWHNWQWFARWIWGEEVELPVELEAGTVTDAAPVSPAAARPRQSPDADAPSYAPPGTPVSLAIAGYAKVLCSAVYVSGRDLDEAKRHSGLFFLEPQQRPGVTGIRLDEAIRGVHVTHGDSVTRTARFHGDQGCIIDQRHRATGPFFTPVEVRTALPAAGAQPWPMGDANAVDPDPDGVDVALLERAVDAAFAPAGLTQAFVVVHGGRIVAERYAPGVDRDRQLESWSMGKTLTAALVGILIEQGELSLDRRAPVPEWQSEDDPRREITIADLLRMSSGLRFIAPRDPDYSRELGYPDHMYIYSGAIDAFRHSITRPLQFEPGTEGRYRNSDPLTLGYLIKRIVTRRGQEYLRWPQQALFDRIGIRRQVMETDPHGNFLLTGFDYGTARNWARLGLLFLNDGVWQGERILPEGYVDFVRTPAPAWDEPVYGGLAWLNNGDWNLPDDAYFMAGGGGQRTFVVPSLDLVVVRLGHFEGADPGMAALDEALGLIREAVSGPRTTRSGQPMER